MKPTTKYNSHRSLMYHQNFTDVCDVDIHIHDKYEIFQALSDNIRYFVEGTAYNLNQGDIIITSNKEIHRPLTVDQKVYGRRFVQFDPSIIQSFADVNYNPLDIFEKRKPGQGNQLIIPSHAKPAVTTYFNTLGASYRSNIPRIIYKNRLTLIKFIMTLEEVFDSITTDKDAPHPIDARIYNVRQYLDRHYTEPFNLDDLSKLYLIDKYHLSHLFKENTGFTLLEYIQSKRIQHAKQLLVGNRTILEICQHCGYADYSNFFKTFKKMVKVSPKEYRAAVKYNSKPTILP